MCMQSWFFVRCEFPFLCICAFHFHFCISIFFFYFLHIVSGIFSSVWNLLYSSLLHFYIYFPSIFRSRESLVSLVTWFYYLACAMPWIFFINCYCILALCFIYEPQIVPMLSWYGPQSLSGLVSETRIVLTGCWFLSRFHTNPFNHSFTSLTHLRVSQHVSGCEVCLSCISILIMHFLLKLSYYVLLTWVISMIYYLVVFLEVPHETCIMLLARAHRVCIHSWWRSWSWFACPIRACAVAFLYIYILSLYLSRTIWLPVCALTNMWNTQY